MSNTVEGERVFCYQCENEWDRAHGGLQCPRCESDFVEILSPRSRTETEDLPEVVPDSPIDQYSSFQSIRDHNPWTAPDPDEGDIHTVHFNGGGNGSTFTFQRTYHWNSGGASQHQDPLGGQDPHMDQVMRDFNSMIAGILGGGTRNTAFGGRININGQTRTFGGGIRDDPFTGPTHGMHDPFSMLFPGAGSPNRQAAGPFGGLLSLLLDPRNARSGDAVYSQEAFDRIMSQLMEQNQQNGAPPASQELISQLPRKNVDKTMTGEDGKAECSICMDEVQMGTEVTVLPCSHWFHFECIESWLKEHDTCPHCRKPITPEDQRHGQGPRRSTRRSSSMATPFPGSPSNPNAVPESPSGVRAAREQYFGRQRYDNIEQRPSSERRSSRRSTGDGEGNGAGGGVGGWIRSHLPFGS